MLGHDWVRVVLLLLQESFEWVDLRELTDEEIKPHSAHPLPVFKPPPAPLPLALSLAAPIAALVPGTTPAQVCV